MTAEGEFRYAGTDPAGNGRIGTLTMLPVSQVLSWAAQRSLLGWKELTVWEDGSPVVILQPDGKLTVAIPFITRARMTDLTAALRSG